MDCNTVRVPNGSATPYSCRHATARHHTSLINQCDGFIHQESDTVPANITQDRPGTYSTSARLYRYPMAHGCEGGCRGNHIAVAHDALSGSQAASESAPDPYQSIQPLAASAVRRQAPETRPCRAPDFAVPDARHAHAALAARSALTPCAHACDGQRRHRPRPRRPLPPPHLPPPHARASICDCVCTILLAAQLFVQSFEPSLERFRRVAPTRTLRIALRIALRILS